MPTTIDNAQPTLALNGQIILSGVFPSQNLSPLQIDREFEPIDIAAADGLIAEINFFGFNFTPRDYASLDGQTLAINNNTALFSILGTTYGGDGQSTFNLPDLDGRLAVGAGQAPGMSSYVLGAVTGAEDIALTQDQLPSGGGGTSQAIDTVQTSLPLNWVITVEGLFPSRSSDPISLDSVPQDGASDFLGMVTLVAGDFAPRGSLFAHGQLLPIADYSALFSLLGTTYGGDGRTTFALPDLRGRTPVGTGNGAGLSPVSLGQKIGAESVSLTDSNLPSGFGGTGAAFNNTGPGLGLTPIVALQGVFPSRSSSPMPLENDAIGGIGSQTVLGEIAFFAGNFVPRGYALANGGLLAISQNQALFSLFGTIYGGDGRTTFGLPDLAGRAIVHAGDSTQIGEKSGSETAVVSPSDIPQIDYTGDGGDNTVNGGLENDTMNGLAGADTLIGNAGNDALNGGADNDRLFGGSGDDNLTGGSGADLLDGGADTDTLVGGPGNDVLIGGGGDDMLTGGSGNDTADYSGAPGPVSVDLAAGTASGDGTDTLVSIERIVGSAFDDTLSGDAGANVIRGEGGEDTIDGRSGNDTLFGGSRADVIFGGAGDDTLSGDNGNDRLYGGSDDDTLLGGNDDDLLVGGPGEDVLNGGAGNDQMIGGSGNDRFVFESGSGDDQIDGFIAGAGSFDVLDFSALGIAFGDLTIAPQGGDTLITTPGGDTILLTGVLPGQLDAVADFVF